MSANNVEKLHDIILQYVYRRVYYIIQYIINIILYRSLMISVKKKQRKFKSQN